ncbi:MAG: acetylxylan esterase [Planctomycetes bacterium]|nr:acetylxylan esterase [Planctomycetota bacterium]
MSRRSPGTIYLEEKVPAYTLPDPLASADGTKVETAAQWKENRRGEILELFRKHVYGRAPSRPEGLSFEVVDKEAKALDGSATRKQVIVRFAAGRDEPAMEVLIYIPNGRRRPVPAFLGLNFQGNHSVHPDPGIRLGRSWMRPGRDGVVDNRATEKSRGAARSRWPIEKILARGYGVATVYYGDIDPDFHDEFRNGVHPLFDDRSLERRPPDAWGSIAAWAWGLSRALDYLETDSDIDGRRIAVLGHSRLGKTALWAGASDERFALVISNNSGCGGAALSRRCFGETVERINRSFPHWFCENFKRYNGRESELPIDQHMLVALMAPRPVYIASADQDLWADPRGEFLSALHASPVYRLLGLEGLPAKEMPPLDRSVEGTIGYHVRSGGHDVKDYDWERYMDFADRHLRAR